MSKSAGVLHRRRRVRFESLPDFAKLVSRSNPIEDFELANVKRVIPRTRYIDDLMWVEVIPRPVASIPAVKVSRQRVDAGLEPFSGVGLAKPYPDVIVAPKSVDPAV